MLFLAWEPAEIDSLGIGVAEFFVSFIVSGET